jgi:hypothetical protein
MKISYLARIKRAYQNGRVACQNERVKNYEVIVYSSIFL